jgi:hypothetical protein
MTRHFNLEVWVWTLPVLLTLGLGGSLSWRLWQARRPLRMTLEGVLR